MSLGELSFIAVITGVPVWLALRVWRRYITVGYVSSGVSWLMRTGLVLVSFSTAMWLAVVALLFLEDHSSGARSIARNLSPAVLGSLNLLLCVGAILCSWFDRTRGQRSLSLRGAIGISSGCLILLWIVVVANPH